MATVPVADRQAQDDRGEAFGALQQAVSSGSSPSELRHCLNRAEAAAGSGDTIGGTALLRAASDTLLRMERGVGVQGAGDPDPPTLGGRACLRPGNSPSRAPNRAERVTTGCSDRGDLLHSRNRRRDHLTPGS